MVPSAFQSGSASEQLCLPLFNEYMLKIHYTHPIRLVTYDVIINQDAMEL